MSSHSQARGVTTSGIRRLPDSGARALRPPYKQDTASRILAARGVTRGGGVCPPGDTASGGDRADNYNNSHSETDFTINKLINHNHTPNSKSDYCTHLKTQTNLHSQQQDSNSLPSSNDADMGVKERFTNDGNVGVGKALDKRVVLNVGGTRHETWISTLERLPGSRLALLAHMCEADEAFDLATGEFFFDRHPKAFEIIIHYFRTNELHVDQSVCGNVLKGELKFWGIEEHEIEACCWASYSKYTEHKETLEELDENFAYVTDDAWAESKSSWRIFASKVWRFMEEPNSSRTAKIYAVSSMFMVAVSIGVFVLETHNLFRIDKHSRKSMSSLLPDDSGTTGGKLTCCCEDLKPVNRSMYEDITHPALDILDYVCISFFTLELLVRFIFAPDKCKFWRQPLNIIDLICLIPHFISIIMGIYSTNDDHITSLLKTIMMMRVIRILRIFKLMKHYNAFKILVYTIKVSTKELLLMIVFLMTGVLMFASIIHYAEQDNFPNIPIAIWWALVTMTTVGYGDKYPTGYVGYATGSICVICGVLVIAFTVPIVVNNFSLYYSHAQTRIKIPHKKKQRKTIEEIAREQQNNQRRQQAPQHPAEMQRPQPYPPGSHVKKPAPPPPQPQRKQKQQVVSTVSSEFTHLQHKEVARENSDDALIGQLDKSKGRKKRPPPPVRKTSTPLTARNIEIEDLDSLDSGFDDREREKKYEEESRRIMNTMLENDNRHEEERKRQEELIRQKRDARKKGMDQRL